MNKGLYYIEKGPIMYYIYPYLYAQGFVLYVHRTYDAASYMIAGESLDLSDNPQVLSSLLHPCGDATP